MARKRKVADTKIEDDGEVTRCVCGHTELPEVRAKQRGADPGLFIQCEKCHAWQHGFCLGFSNGKEVPDVYYCEECKPELHEIAMRAHGRTSRYLPHQRKQRSRSNRESETASGEGSASESESEKPVFSEVSRRAARKEKARRTLDSREDAILRRVLEQSALEAQKADNRRSRTSGRSSNEGSPPGSSDVKKERGPGPSDEEMGHSSANDHAVLARATSDDAPDTENETRPTRKRPGPKSRQDPANRGLKQQKSQSETSSAPRAGRKQQRRCKPRIPPPRASFAEMRKRITAILEFSGHTQVDMLSEARAREQLLEEQKSQSADPAVIEQLQELCGQHQRNMGLLEDLTRKLLAWQDQYC